MNGFKLKAYTNLFKKAKNLDVDKIKKKNIEKKNITVNDMYDEIYLSENARRSMKSSMADSKYLKKIVKRDSREIREYNRDTEKANFRNNKNSKSVKYFHPFLADE